MVFTLCQLLRSDVRETVMDRDELLHNDMEATV